MRATETPSLQPSKIHYSTPFKQYYMLEKIGVGGQGVVWSALDQALDRIVAVKFIEPALDDQAQIDDWVMDRQIPHLAKLHHPNILPLYDYGLSGNVRYLVSAYASGGSLSRWIKAGKFTTQDALRCLKAVASGLEYLHEQGIIHRDLKPGNILLNCNQHPFLTDFGLAREVTTDTRVMHTGRGTPPYAPPEQHKMTEITQASDIYSFGIMLYELFTRQLPWNGEKFLAVQQLQSNTEIPDPCEIDPALPPTLVRVLRSMTAAEPSARPATVAQVMEMLAICFDTLINFKAIQSQLSNDGIEKANALELIRQSLQSWAENKKEISISLTTFALIDRHLKREGIDTLPPNPQHFMLQHALAYGYNHDFWWKHVPELSRRLDIASTLMGIKKEEIVARTVNLLLKDTDLKAIKGLPPASITTTLLETAVKSNDPWLRRECLDALLMMMPPAKGWREVALNPEQDSALANLALEESEQGEKAARLIGHLQSRTATQRLIQQANADRRITALQMIQKEAGSLPSSTDLNVRLGVSLDWIMNQLVARPLTLLAAYATTFLGSALGFGLIFYLAYRFPEYLDTLRFTTSLVRAVILGIPFSFGIFLTRLFAERFHKVRLSLRVSLASIIGSLVLLLAVNVFHLLILNTPPSGILIAAGCLLTALGFSLGSLKKSRLWKIGTSLVASFAALAGSWWIHLAEGSASQTPMIPFEAGLPVIQVVVRLGIAVLLITSLGNSVNLRLTDGE